MRILSIGNSFSQDAHRWLHGICESQGVECECVNLYIGGCALETHWYNYENNLAEYDYELNGVFTKKSSINEALAEKDWDIITFQQVSQLSGVEDSYNPYLLNLSKAVKKEVPGAKFYIHEIWSYESDSTHGGFVLYDNDQRKMYNCLKETYKKAGELINAPVIPSGDVIQYLRENVEYFDYKNGGKSLNRDGYHLSHTYGRYAAALTWYGILFNADVLNVDFMPEDGDEIVDEEILKLINKAVSKVIAGGK